MSNLPETCRALVLNSRNEPLELKHVETPKPGPGSVVVRILVANVLPYASEVYTGKRPYPFPTPLIPGSGAVGRVAAIGPDTTAFAEGELVLIDVFFHARDDPLSTFLFGLHSGTSAGTQKLMDSEWRNATYAEFAKVPLENCTKLPRDGNPSELAYLSRLLVPLGGLVDIAVQPGETIVVAPATGSFGGAAVEVALGLGAKVVAAGRNKEALESLKASLKNERLRIVQLTGDAEQDSSLIGACDAYIDFSPPAAAKSTHILSCLMALRAGGRVSLMGGIQGAVEIPYSLVMFKSLKLQGKFMYDRDVPKRLVSLAGAGLIKTGMNKTKIFELEDWQLAFEDSAANSGWGFQTLIAPGPAET